MKEIQAVNSVRNVAEPRALATPLRAAGVVLVALVATISASAQGLVQETIGVSHTAGIGREVRMLPDVDGDGHPDFAAAAIGVTNSNGRVYVYSGLDRSVLLVLIGNTNGSNLGAALAPVGDVDHDGLGDFAAGAPGESKVYVFKGSDGSVLHALADGGNGSLGLAVAGAGDVDGDGWPDVLGGAPNLSTWQSTVGRAYVYSGFDGSLIRTHEGAVPLQGAGFRLAGDVDVDGDSRPDYLIADSFIGGAPASAVRLYSGASGNLLKTFSILPEPQEFGTGLAFVDDLDGDGRRDVAIGSPGDSTLGIDTGRVDWFSSSTGALIRTAWGPNLSGRFGAAISDAGDLNGDGFRDLWVAAPGRFGTWGRIRLISGSDMAVILTIPGIASDFLPNVSGGVDLDGDGALDLVAGMPGTFRVYSTAPTAGTSYCTAKTNSRGCIPLMSANGTASRSGPDDFHLTATNVLNNKPGILIWSRARGLSPLGGGQLCLNGPVFRRPLAPSGGSPTGLDCTGVFDYGLSHLEMNILGMLAGDTIYSQLWSRDPGFSPPNNISLSNGWIFTMAP